MEKQNKTHNKAKAKKHFVFGSGVLCLFGFAFPMTAFSAPLSSGITMLEKNPSILLLLVALAAFGFCGIVACFWALRTVRKLAPRMTASARAGFATELHNYDQLLVETGQCAVIWQDIVSPPRILGRLSHLDEIGIGAQDFLRFGRWLEEAALRRLDQALNDLRLEAKPFELYLETRNHVYLQVTGVIAGTVAIARFQDISLREAQNARLQSDMSRMAQEMALLHKLLNVIEQPVWLQNLQGHCVFSNQAFQKAMGQEEPKPEQGISFFNEATRRIMAESGPLYQGQAYGVVDGERRSFFVTQIISEEGTATFAEDKTDSENLAQDMARIIRGHSETLDQFSTAVSIFGADQKLKFANQAFASLWPLDSAFLESEPSHTLVLDRLREKGIIAEQPDWRGWKDDLFSAYHSGEPSQQIWNLPDGRTLRVVASPHPQGGVTWLYENLTEKIDLERRYNTLIKMQGETLDHLSEGVAVFGADGKVRLSNPALAKLWSLPHDLMVEGTHISKLQAHCAPLTDGQEWSRFGALITGFAETRDAVSGRMDLLSGIVLDYALVPLPNGQTMTTFVNVTDTVNITRALQEKNEALESADQLRNDFVQHVSYELRTPLTNIIGFSDMLGTETFGPLNARQNEYLDHISSESAALLNIVNDILDLATLDAGVMELDIREVNIADSMSYARERTKERLGNRPVNVAQTIDPALQYLPADTGRLRQIFVNVLSNAANFAPDGSTITFAAEKQGDDVVFTVHDDGCGIPDDILDTVFKRFSSHSHHGARAGAGLGLSIVKSFVELHGGSVAIETGNGKGTTVICRFPAQRPPLLHDVSSQLIQ